MQQSPFKQHDIPGFMASAPLDVILLLIIVLIWVLTDCIAPDSPFMEPSNWHVDLMSSPTISVNETSDITVKSGYLINYITVKSGYLINYITLSTMFYRFGNRVRACARVA